MSEMSIANTMQVKTAIPLHLFKINSFYSTSIARSQRFDDDLKPQYLWKMLSPSFAAQTDSRWGQEWEVRAPSFGIQIGNIDTYWVEEEMHRDVGADSNHLLHRFSEPQCVMPYVSGQAFRMKAVPYLLRRPSQLGTDVPTFCRSPAAYNDLSSAILSACMWADGTLRSRDAPRCRVNHFYCIKVSRLSRVYRQISWESVCCAEHTITMKHRGSMPSWPIFIFARSLVSFISSKTKHPNALLLYHLVVWRYRFMFLRRDYASFVSGDAHRLK